MNTILKVISLAGASLLLLTVIVIQNITIEQISVQLLGAVASLTVYVYLEHKEIGVVKPNGS